MKVPNHIKPTTTLNCRGKLLTLDRPRIMGILNTTPDSFFDGGRYTHVDNALRQVEKMLAEGADIIDVGGYSTRPGAGDISPEEEADRTAKIIEAIISRFPEAIISIDTFRASVAEVCLKAGASIVNDISAGDDDPEMIPLVAKLNVPYIIMHKQGNPQTMQQNPAYTDVVTEVLTYLIAKTDYLHSLGMKDIIIDPGFGFGKTLTHNYLLLEQMDSLTISGLPVLIGVSRKSMVNKVLGIKAADALNGTTVINTISVLKGAKIIRVHDIKEAAEMVRLVTYFSDIHF